MEWMHGGGRDPNGRSLDDEIKIGKEDWLERQRVAAGGRIGFDSGQLVQPGPGRLGFKDAGLVDSMKIRFDLGDDIVENLNILMETDYPKSNKPEVIQKRIDDFAIEFKKITNRLPTANEIRGFGASSTMATSTKKAKYMKEGINYMEETDEMKKIKRIDRLTPDSPNVKKAFELYDQGWKKKTIAEELKIDRTQLRKWFHQWRPEDIGDENKPKGKKYNYKAVRAQRIRALESMLKKMPGGKKTLDQTIALMDKIWAKNDEILKMGDDEIWNNKLFREAMNLDVTDLKKGKGINFNRYADLSKEEFVAKIKAMAKNHEFYQPEHIIPISSQRTASLFPKNIQVAVGKVGSQMETLKSFVQNNPDSEFISGIDEFLTKQKCSNSKTR